MASSSSPWLPNRLPTSATVHHPHSNTTAVTAGQSHGGSARSNPFTSPATGFAGSPVPDAELVQSKPSAEVRRVSDKPLHKSSTSADSKRTTSSESQPGLRLSSDSRMTAGLVRERPRSDRSRSVPVVDPQSNRRLPTVPNHTAGMGRPGTSGGKLGGVLSATDAVCVVDTAKQTVVPSQGKAGCGFFH